MVFKLCVSTPPLGIVVNIRASPKNSPAGSPLRIVQQEGFRLTFPPPSLKNSGLIASMRLCFFLYRSSTLIFQSYGVFHLKTFMT